MTGADALPAARVASWERTTAVDPRNSHPVPLACEAPADLDHELIKAAFDHIGREAFRHATAAGFWATKNPRLAVFEKLCLVVTEIGEAIEHLRYGRWRTMPREASKEEVKRTGQQYVDEEGFIDELADVVIRLADLCIALDLDLGEAIGAKMAKNRERAFQHGGKRF
jgi:NTP pyrophosphatase (non-canonical NTP hydrolase)